MPLMLDQLGPCPVCGAAVAATGPLYRQHMDWHTVTGTYLAHGGSPAVADDDTLQFPPIRETIFRRPPPPAVRELRGSELLRALAEELARDEHEDQDDEDGAGGACGLCGRSVVFVAADGRWRHASASDHDVIDVMRNS